MGAYGYVRISRDEDSNKESISSQKDTLKDFAKDQGIEMIDIIEDNDISGYSYNRPGIKKILKLIDEGVLDVLVAKDLSRIGRHNAKTLMFIEYLKIRRLKYSWIVEKLMKIFLVFRHGSMRITSRI